MLKIKLTLTFLITTLLALTLPTLAQNDEKLEKEIEAKIGKSSPRKSIDLREMKEAEKLILDGPIPLPAKCPLGMQQTVLAGLIDGAAPPSEPAYKSPALLQGYPPNMYIYEDFDDPMVNRLFGYSFMLNKLKPCDGKICRAVLHIRICNKDTDLWTNDRLYIGTVPMGGPIDPWVFYGQIWGSVNERNTCKDLYFNIHAPTLWNKPTLDVLVQDDSIVDYMKLYLNY